VNQLQIHTGRLVQGLILLGFSVFLSKLFGTGEIHKLVSPKMTALLGITLVLLIVMTLYTLIASYTHKSNCDHHDHEHDHESKPKKGWVLFLVPILLGVMVPVQSLGTSMMNSGMYAKPQTKTAVQVDKQPTEAASSDSTAMEKVDLSKVPKVEMKDYPKPPKPVPGSVLPVNQVMENILIAPEYYFNQRYKFQGFVYHPPGWAQNRMVLMRYVMVHCAADTVPVGLTVEMEGADKYKNDTWLEIDGSVLTRRVPEADKVAPVAWYYGYDEKPTLIPHGVKTIQEPKDPYVYPNMQTVNLTPGVK
jgi:uncharacterized repeat protein (TIGR03943 family)